MKKVVYLLSLFVLVFSSCKTTSKNIELGFRDEVIPIMLNRMPDNTPGFEKVYTVGTENRMNITSSYMHVMDKTINQDIQYQMRSVIRKEPACIYINKIILSEEYQNSFSGESEKTLLKVKISVSE